MIGLVNAAGTPETSRVQSAYRDVVDSFLQNGGKIIPILNSEQAAVRVLQSAIQTISDTNSEAQRGVPDGEQSDRFAQADLEQRGKLDADPTQALGRDLDVTA
jgi:hypothetical protein